MNCLVGLLVPQIYSSLREVKAGFDYVFFSIRNETRNAMNRAPLRLQKCVAALGAAAIGECFLQGRIISRRLASVMIVRNFFTREFLKA